ncbi:iron-siderophore ABC transporter substrate-binding protein [Gordonia sp. HY442]|uniref:iron-siderophore ABC transporter substrate-binding protein n=1 Tax=Gordonia zhenghanii TaxID=2911516 RepID=UPI001F25842C|nr:iron-siderophore ABC transporter substrate-binding protein [Gordonia zhenghanii]MCF8605847.1 iron-siderophore ABC transporter substrate-binding protein [Gordonia zhenghanii]
MRKSRFLSLVCAAALAVTATACSSSDESASGAAGGEGFPVTIEHALGTTTIEAPPERVATVGWANHEVPLALGVVPVGMAKATWGDDNGDGILPWVDDKLTELGGDKPELYDETDAIDYEAVGNSAPDVILAAYSGLTQEQYDKLTKIAPVVAYPKVPWGTTWQDMVTLDSKAIGREDDGRKLVDDLTGQVDAAVAKHPDLKNTKTMFAFLDPTDTSKIGFYNTNDPRAAFLRDAGLPVPSAVEKNSADTAEFYTEVSAEKADQFNDVGLIVTYGDENTLSRLQADPLLGKIPAVKAGHVAILQQDTPLAASSNPTPLSIPWGVGKYVDILGAAITP